MLEQCRAQGQRREREVSVCWPTASASDIINFFSAPSHSTWIHYGAPRLHLAFILQFENKMSKKFLHKT